MDKEEQERELQNLALVGCTGRSGDIYQATAERDRQNIINKDNRKNEQAFLVQYQQLVKDIDSLLNDTETQLYETIQAYEKRLEQELQKASRTEDGRIVFKDKDGNIHAYDRPPLSEEEILSIRWKPDSCDWETVQYIGENLQKLRAMKAYRLKSTCTAFELLHDP